jgi:hypothetical protein
MENAKTKKKISRRSGKHSNHIKYDEERPVCSRCRNFGVECDGYRSEPIPSYMSICPRHQPCYQNCQQANHCNPRSAEHTSRVTMKLGISTCFVKRPCTKSSHTPSHNAFSMALPGWVPLSPVQDNAVLTVN